MKSMSPLAIAALFVSVALLPQPAAAQSFGSPILIHVDGPFEASSTTPNFRVFGWALDLVGIPGGPRIDTVQIFLDRPAGFGTYLGSGVLTSRPDVAFAYGRPEEAAAGFDVELTNVPEGNHTLYVYAFANQGVERPYLPVQIRVDPFLTPAPPATAYGVCSAPVETKGVPAPAYPAPNPFCTNPLTQAPATIVRADGVTVVVDRMVGDARLASVTARVCNLTSVRAGSIRVEFGFYTQYAPGQIAQISSDSYRFPGSLAPGACQSFQTYLTPLGRWDLIRVDAVAWTPEGY